MFVNLSRYVVKVGGGRTEAMNFTELLRQPFMQGTTDDDVCKLMDLQVGETAVNMSDRAGHDIERVA